MTQPRKRVHLVCHAHLDPVWLWQWEDGMTQALATFRAACDFCDQRPGFIFCHNESLLYKWVEDHDPALHRRIQRLVRAGRWSVAGGGYVQPDINVTSGESHIRQFLLGKDYFRDRFGAEPTTAYNFDTFGHAEGYPQILAGCGFDSYIFCRPGEPQIDLPFGPFRWRDRSGREVLARRSAESYPTQKRAATKLAEWMSRYDAEPVSLFLWGIGNHGGGPNHEDLQGIEQFGREHPQYEFVHSTPERFFADARRMGRAFPVVQGELQRIFPGCYTSMSRVKRAHRACESLAALTERMAAMAWWLGRAPYPARDLDVAWKDILFGEFHDILPGSSIQPAEADSIALFGHGSEVLRRAKARVFVRLLENEARPAPGATPIFVWNPHSFAVSADMECEFHYANFSSPGGTIELTVRDYATGRKLLFQRETAYTPLKNDMRMRISLPFKLEPWQTRRVEVTWRQRETPKPWTAPKASAGLLDFRGRGVHVRINPRTGLIDFAAPAGARRSLLRPGALKPVIFNDTVDAWTCGAPGRAFNRHDLALAMRPWRAPRDTFRLARRDEVARVSPPPPSPLAKAGARRNLDPVRVVEHGPTRTIVEAVFVAGQSAIVRRYVLSRSQNWLEVRDRIYWNEKDALLKVAAPLAFEAEGTISETPYSAALRPAAKDHVDNANQRWVAAVSARGRAKPPGFVAVLNDSSNAHSLWKDTLYLNVLRSPIYAVMGMDPAWDPHEKRCWPRQDQGEHEVRWRIMLGARFNEAEVSRQAQAMNIAPDWLIHFPAGQGKDSALAAAPFVRVSAPNVQVAAVKKAENSEELVVRLWEQAGRRTEVWVTIAGAAGAARTTIGAYGLQTLLLKRKGGKLV